MPPEAQQVEETVSAEAQQGELDGMYTDDAPAAKADAEEATETVEEKSEDAPEEKSEEATEEKSDDEEKSEDKDDADATDGDSVPEGDYEFEMPEGMELDADFVAEVTPKLKELDVSGNLAKELGKIMAAKAVKDSEAMQKAAADQFAEVTEGYITEIKNDKELGGRNFEEASATAAAAVDKFGSPEVKDFLNASGMGNHPALVRMFYKVGKATSEDDLSATGDSVEGNSDAARLKAMYPDE